MYITQFSKYFRLPERIPEIFRFPERVRENCLEHCPGTQSGIPVRKDPGNGTEFWIFREIFHNGNGKYLR